jgi:hypothetical protein
MSDIRLRGGADVVVTKRWPVRFGVGTSPYVIAAARRGKLERVTIKKIIRTRASNGLYPVFNYMDSFNELWLDNELCWQSDAVLLATQYWERVVVAQTLPT